MTERQKIAHTLYHVAVALTRYTGAITSVYVTAGMMPSGPGVEIVLQGLPGYFTSRFVPDKHRDNLGDIISSALSSLETIQITMIDSDIE